MKKIKIGIPRTALYNKNGTFLKNFFLGLGCKVILSKETDINIINMGVNNISKDNCYLNKIYLGHILQLSNSCDYIIIYTNCSYSNECIQNMILQSNLKKHLISSQILSFNSSKNIFFEFIKLGFKLSKNPIKILYSYFFAKSKQKNYEINKQNYQKNKITNLNNKVLIVSNYTNIEDNYTSKYIINYLERNKITPLFSNCLPIEQALLNTDYIYDKTLTKDTKILFGVINYYKYIVKGMIYISNENCQMDKYIYSKIKEETLKVPMINISINEVSNNIKIETKLELLIDTINKNNNI